MVWRAHIISAHVLAPSLAASYTALAPPSPSHHLNALSSNPHHHINARTRKQRNMLRDAWHISRWRRWRGDINWRMW